MGSLLVESPLPESRMSEGSKKSRKIVSDVYGLVSFRLLSHLTANGKVSGKVIKKDLAIFLILIFPASLLLNRV